MPLSKEGLKKSSARSDSHQWRPGRNVIRILPPTKAYFTEVINDFAIKFFVHYNLGPEGSPPVTCPRSFDDKVACPACAATRKLYRIDTASELARQIGRKVRFVMSILDVEQPNGIEIVEIGTKIHEPIVQVAVDPDSGDIIDINSGRNFCVVFTPGSRETRGFNQYVVTASLKKTSVKELLDGVKGWADQLDSLKDHINKSPSLEEIAKMVEAVAGDLGDITSPRAPSSAKTTVVGEDEFPDPGASSDVTVRAGSSGSARDEFPSDTVEKGSEQSEGVKEPAQSPQQSPDGKPPCFGKEYAPGTERCKVCEHKDPCTNEFLAS